MWDHRLESLFVQLSEKEYRTAQLLAKYLHISSKTVRSRIKDLNDEIQKHGAYIEAKYGAGYRLQVTDGDFYQALSLAKSSEQRTRYLSSQQNRVQYLQEYLLNCRGYIKMDDLSEYLYISRKTLMADLKELEKNIARYNLKLVRKPNKGIRIEGDEFYFRLCMAHSTVIYETQDALGMEGFEEDKKIKAIALNVQNIIQDYDIKISDTMFQNLIVHIYVAMKRMEEQNFVPMEAVSLTEIAGTKEHDAAKAIGEILKRIFELSFSESEIKYIAIHLSGKKYLESTEGNLVIGQEIGDAVTEMLNRVYDAFKFDFREDLELRLSLCQHIIPLAVRIQYGMNMQNPMLSEIKGRFSLAYAMAAHASTVLVQNYHTLLKEEEVGYLALAFALALERQRVDFPKKNILLVCSSGKGGARLLQYRYEELFGKYIHRIETCDAGRLDQIDFKEFDYIFTTVPIDREAPIPIQEVKYFLGEGDVQAIRSYLAYGTKCLIQQYFTSRLFFPGMKAQTKDEAIKEISGYAVRELGVSPKLYQAVLEREELAPTAFGNLAAMPHPNYTVSENTFICVGILEKPVLWGEMPVQVVFLVSIGSKKDKNLKMFYRIISEYLLYGDGVSQLIEEGSYEGFIHNLQQIEIRLGKEGEYHG